MHASRVAKTLSKTVNNHLGPFSGVVHFDAAEHSVSAQVHADTATLTSDLEKALKVLDADGAKPKPFKNMEALAKTNPELANWTQAMTPALNLMAADLTPAPDLNIGKAGFVLQGAESHTGVACAFFGGHENHGDETVSLVVCGWTTRE